MLEGQRRTIHYIFRVNTVLQARKVRYTTLILVNPPIIVPTFKREEYEGFYVVNYLSFIIDLESLRLYRGIKRISNSQTIND